MELFPPGMKWGNYIYDLEEQERKNREAKETPAEKEARVAREKEEAMKKRWEEQEEYERSILNDEIREAREMHEREAEAERIRAEIKELDRKKKEAQARLQKAEAESLEAKKAANLLKKTTKYVSKEGTMKKIAKPCKWECTGQKCWAKEEGACPFLHTGDPGFSQNKPVSKAFVKSLKNKKRGGAAKKKTQRKNRH